MGHVPDQGPGQQTPSQVAFGEGGFHFPEEPEQQTHPFLRTSRWASAWGDKAVYPEASQRGSPPSPEAAESEGQEAKGA